MDVLIPALFGLIGGVTGSLVAPWVQWAVEKRRTSLEYRKGLIRSWREGIERFDFDTGNFGDTAMYSAMRPHMAAEIVERLEKPRMVMIGEGRGELVRKHFLLDEVSRIERMWQLV